jgi:Stress responsive A/B Barrel Domain
MNTTNSSFVHHVLFYLKNPNSAEDKAQLIEGLQALSKVPCIVFSNIGSPANTTRDIIEKDYSISWLCLFESPEKEEEYQVHPLHDAFKENCHHLWQKVVIYDALGC